MRADALCRGRKPAVWQLEAICMLAERYLKRRYEEGREEERRRQKRYRARLKAWDARRLKSEAAGEPFDEPLPEFDDDDKSEVDA